MSGTRAHRITVWGLLLGTTLWGGGRDGLAQTPAVTSEPTPGSAAGEPAPAKPSFAMTPAVACVRVDGLDQITPLPAATLTNADKLKVYFRPLHYQVETDPSKKARYRVKFSEDGRIRRKGEKTAIAKEDKLLEYETRYEAEGYQIYLVNIIGLESLSPGEYEFDITLHDLIDGRATAKQSLPFTIIPIAGATTARPPTESTPKKAVRSGRPLRRPE